MAIKLCSSVLLVLLVFQVRCENVEVYTADSEDTKKADGSSFKGASVLFGTMNKNLPKLNAVLEFPSLICLKKGQFLSILSKSSTSKDYNTFLYSSVDFSKYNEAWGEFFNVNVKLEEKTELCFLYGHYTYLKVSGIYQIHIYFTFFSDKITIDDKEVHYLSMATESNIYSTMLSENGDSKQQNEIAGQVSRKYELKEIVTEDCKKESEASYAKVVVNKQQFAFDRKGIFNIAFVNRIELNKPIDKSVAGKPGLECVDSKLNILYSGQERTVKKQVPEETTPKVPEKKPESPSNKKTSKGNTGTKHLII